MLVPTLQIQSRANPFSRRPRQSWGSALSGLGLGPPPSDLEDCSRLPFAEQWPCVQRNNDKVIRASCEHGDAEDCRYLGIAPPVGTPDYDFGADQKSFVQALNTYYNLPIPGTPGASFQPITTTVPIPPPVVVQQLATPPSTPVVLLPPPPQLSPDKPGTFRLTNDTRPGDSNFRVGDRYSVSIKGASPNLTVRASAMQNSTNRGDMAFGPTDGAGNFFLSGVMEFQHIGYWVEHWLVGTALSGVAAFIVSPLELPPAQGAPSGPVPPVPTPPADPPADDAPSTPPPSDATPWYSHPDNWSGIADEWLSAKADVGGMSIPWWIFGLGAAALVYAFKGGER